MPVRAMFWVVVSVEELVGVLRADRCPVPVVVEMPGYGHPQGRGGLERVEVGKDPPQPSKLLLALIRSDQGGG